MVRATWNTLLSQAVVLLVLEKTAVNGAAAPALAACCKERSQQTLERIQL
jgi:hypothetical protein